MSALVIGDNLGIPIPVPGRPCTCAVSLAFPGKDHRTFECPIRYHRVMGQCPGWTPLGARIPACWAGNELTPACRADWKTFADRLPVARAASGVSVSF